MLRIAIITGSTRPGRNGEAVVIKTVGRLIGNAVPPKLGEAVAKTLYASLPTVTGAAGRVAG